MPRPADANARERSRLDEARGRPPVGSHVAARTREQVAREQVARGEVARVGVARGEVARGVAALRDGARARVRARGADAVGARSMAIIFPAVAFLACAREPPPPPPPPPAVVLGDEDVHAVTRMRLETGPLVSGSLEPKRQAVLRAEAQGSVVALNVELGEPVKQGQLLARIEDQGQADQAQATAASVTAAEEESLLAARQLERTRSLVKAGALAERDLELAQSAASAAAARLAEAVARQASARHQLEGQALVAPFAGVVSERTVHLGDVVQPGAALLSIIDPSTMRLEASVPSESLAAVAVGRDVRFRVRGYPDQEFVGQIERVAPSADPATRQIKILVDVPNEGGRLIAGLFAEGRVAASAKEALVVPLGALDLSGTEPRVARVADGKVEVVPVTLGLRDERLEVVEVAAGLAAGDVVLIGGARSLAPGTAVTRRGATTTVGQRAER